MPHLAAIEAATTAHSALGRRRISRVGARAAARGVRVALQRGGRRRRKERARLTDMVIWNMEREREIIIPTDFMFGFCI